MQVLPEDCTGPIGAVAEPATDEWYDVKLRCSRRPLQHRGP
jgi:hypothetical protein